MSDLLDPRAVHKEHTHPGAGLYLKVGFVLLVLTALEVAAYEVGHRPGALQPIVGPWVVEILLVLSALKFYLVAMFYMHLKQDAKIFRGLFAFPLIIAAVVIVALVVLMAYWRI
jgi:caa(3)-type oxidase subunit IV